MLLIALTHEEQRQGRRNRILIQFKKFESRIIWNSEYR